jgi:phospho-N-acetylmuramoyl-pentapeptide-transferase
MEIVSLNIPALSRIFLLAFFSFILAFAWTPILTSILYKYRLGKKIRDRKDTPVYAKLHQKKAGIPTMGGLLVWITVMIITLLFNLTRSQTWLPLFALVTTGVLGAIDDLLNIRGIGPAGGGLKARHKLVWLLMIAALGAWWFYYKLEINSIHVPGVGDFTIGLWFIPLFILVIVSTANAVNITDGLDGLAGGLLAMSYLSFGVIAFVQQQYGIAAFCGSIVGALLAFLWFNIYPARFIMGDTGALALGATLGVIAMLTNSVVILPIVGFVFVMETLSVIIQRIYKRFTGGKKIFLSSPIHHHFEAIGWPETKVTMRFWIIGAVAAIVGLVIGLIGRG